MTTCRCKYLNVVSGDMAREYIESHLDRIRVDGMGRSVFRCADTEIDWVEEREPAGYGDDVSVLRRSDR